MPNIKSASKRDKIAKARNAKNKAVKTALRTNIKRFETSVTEGAPEAKENFKVAVKSVDRAVSKGLIHKNAAARKKSQMARKINAITQ